MYRYGTFDWSTILYYVGIVIALVSVFLSIKVNSTYRRISKNENARRISGRETAVRILSANGLGTIGIRSVSGVLSDNYDPTSRTLNLSADVMNGRNIAAVAVAAHECGHAIQHAENYRPMTVRSKLVPAANLGSRFGVYVFLAGLLLGSFGLGFLMDVGIGLFSLSVLFHVVTLGVEFDASSRGLDALTSCGILMDEEMPKAKKMLRAAACTYVAAMSSSIVQLLRFVAMRDSRRR